MKMSQKKMVLYGFLLLAGGVGLLIDRMYVLPASAEAAGALDVALRSGRDSSESLPIGEGPPLAAIFDPTKPSASALEGPDVTPESMILRDAFGLTPVLREIYQARSEEEKKEKEIEAEKKAEERQRLRTAFQADHALRGVCIHPDDRWVIVDDRVLRIGDRLDGFVLREIHDYRAVFQGGKGSVELLLPRETAAKVGR